MAPVTELNACFLSAIFTLSQRPRPLELSLTTEKCYDLLIHMQPLAHKLLCKFVVQDKLSLKCCVRKEVIQFTANKRLLLIITIKILIVKEVSNPSISKKSLSKTSQFEHHRCSLYPGPSNLFFVSDLGHVTLTMVGTSVCVCVVAV